MFSLKETFSMNTSQEREAGPLDVQGLRKAFGSFVTGVTVVSAVDDQGHYRGLTANSFTSVSLDPPLVLVCIDNKATTCPVFEQASSFAVNVLAAEQRDVSNTFASRTPDKFHGVPTHVATTGAPLLEGAIAWFDCAKEQFVTAGDHTMLIGRVLDFGHTGGVPLAYCRGSYIDFGLEQKAVGAGKSLNYGCVANLGDAVLMVRDPLKGSWTIPTAGHGADQHAPGGLPDLVAKLGATVELSFLYSVFENAGESFIVYRGTLADEPQLTKSAALFTQETMPWDQIGSSQTRNMLRRYFLERADARFGIYMDSADGGKVAMLDGALKPFNQLDMGS